MLPMIHNNFYQKIESCQKDTIIKLLPYRDLNKAIRLFMRRNAHISLIMYNTGPSILKIIEWTLFTFDLEFITCSKRYAATSSKMSR